MNRGLAGEENEHRSTFETYRAEGDILFKNGEFRKAIESYTTALGIQNCEKNCLVARSRCHLELGAINTALTDAEASLRSDNAFHKGLYQKAEVLYCKGEFELALVFYHRGCKLRPELQEFRLGIQKAQEAIDNSVGSPDKVKLTKDGDLSFFKELAEPKKPKPAVFKRGPARQATTKRLPPKSASQDKSIKQLLGELYGDRIYLEKLLKETDSTTEAGRNIYDLVCDGLHYLDTRTEFWRQQKPMYARRRDLILRRVSRGAGREILAQYIKEELEKIDHAQGRGHYRDSQKKAHACLKTLAGYAPNAIQNREAIVSSLYSYIGNSHLELGEYDAALECHNTDLHMAQQHKMKEAQSRALDNLGRVYARKGEFQSAITMWLKKLPLSESPMENAWLFHELGRCHLELGHYSEAKEFGHKSVAAAADAGDSLWQLNATVLVAQAQLILNELEGASTTFAKSLEMATRHGDDSAATAIRRALDDIDTRLQQKAKEDIDKDDHKDEKPKDEDKQPSEHATVHWSTENE